ncbi:MAG: hypothetical protein Q7R22_016645 [Verrucomicrobiota bacterium JB025]|nr:hypothetical protein [Verrucomicrobiota bacterium JB025]
MKYLKTSEIKKWLTGQGMRHQPLDCGVPIAGEYHLPTGAIQRSRLAADLADMLSKDGTKLVEIIPSGSIHPDDLMRLNQFRANFGEHGQIIETPGQLFKSGDRAAFREMLAMIFTFKSGWTLYVYSAPSGNTLLIGDQIDIWATKKGLRNALAKRLEPVARPKAA